MLVYKSGGIIMEGIDLLQNLKDQHKVLFDTVKAQEELLAEKLYTFFQTIGEGS